MPSQARQLAAILFTDIVGYTAMMQQDEQNAVAVTKHYAAVLKQSVPSHGGEILNDYGDGNLCSFTSATEAVKCAIEMQQQLQAAPMVPLRIGLHIGEIFFEDGKVFGDGVNVASRIQSLGVGNSILFSTEINSKIKNQQEFKTVSVGHFHFKNVDATMEVFALANEGFVIPDKNKIAGKLQEKKALLNKKSIAGLLLLLSAAVLSYFLLYKKSAPSAEDISIAILPFKIIGTDSNALSEGLVEDILNRLSKIKDMRKVIHNRSSVRFANSQKSLSDIGRELNVTYLVTGSIQQSPDSIRVSAQLIDSKTEYTLWTDVFDRRKIQALGLQTELASIIVEKLKASLSPDEKKGLAKKYTENIEAYKYYIRGRNFWNKRGRDNYDSAEANFREAIKLDPNYALAYAGIADCYTYNVKGLSQLEAIPIARTYANEALSRDENLSEGLTSLGFIQHNFDYAWLQSRKTLEKAIELDPNNPIAHMYYGNLLQYTGETEKGLAEAEKAVELDPFSYATNWVLGRNYYFAGKYDKAIEKIKKSLQVAPKQQEITAWSLGLVYAAKKMYTEAKKEFDKLSTTEHNNSKIDHYIIMQSYGYGLTGDKIKAKELLDKILKEENNESLSPYRLSQVYIALEDFKEGLNQLDKAYEIRDLHMFWLKVDPGFDPIRNQPRFKELLKKIGLE